MLLHTNHIVVCADPWTMMYLRRRHIGVGMACKGTAGNTSEVFNCAVDFEMMYLLAVNLKSCLWLPKSLCNCYRCVPCNQYSHTKMSNKAIYFECCNFIYMTKTITTACNRSSNQRRAKQDLINTETLLTTIIWNQPKGWNFWGKKLAKLSRLMLSLGLYRFTMLQHYRFLITNCI